MKVNEQDSRMYYSVSNYTQETKKFGGVQRVWKKGLVVTPVGMEIQCLLISGKYPGLCNIINQLLISTYLSENTTSPQRFMPAMYL